jgi:hypothetical protein
MALRSGPVQGYLIHNEGRVGEILKREWVMRLAITTTSLTALP